MAVSELAALERALHDRVGCLDRVEQEVERDVLRQSPRALVSVAALLLREPSGWRNDPARRLQHVERLAKAFARAEEGAAARETAATLYTVIGGAGRQVRRHETLLMSREVFLRAVALQPANVAAIAGLADVAEKLGDYREAFRRWQDVLDSQPDFWRARFGLGFNLLRGGEPRRGSASLTALLAADSPDWVRVVTYQELARATAEHDPAAAVALLRRGIAELPGEPSLSLLLAAVEPAEQASLTTALERAARSRPAAELSPRVIYDLGPIELLEVAVAQAVRLDEAARGDLAKAVRPLRHTADVAGCSQEVRR